MMSLSEFNQQLFNPDKLWNQTSRLKEEYLIKEEYLVKSNQVCARMEIVISDCQATIAKNILYCYKDLI
jgi:hypothetical protein